MKLYEYQETAVKSLLQDKHMLIAGTGLGKGFISLEWARKTGKHNIVVVTQASKRDAGDFPKEAKILDEKWFSSLSSFTTLSWNGLAKWFRENRYNITDDYAFIFDECLPADTKVKTDKGEVEIADLKVGDKVLSYNEKTGKTEFKTITRTIKKKAPEIMYRHRSHNGAIIATSNHPHYIGDGYAKAETIKQGDFLYEYKRTGDSLQDKKIWRKKTVCNLWKGNPNQRLDDATDTTDFKRQDLLLKGMWDEDGQAEIFGAYVCEQSNEKQIISLESPDDKGGTWVQTSLDGQSRTKRREWEDNETSGASIYGTRKDKQRLGYGTTSWFNPRVWVSKVLQVRHWKRLLQDRSGVRWGKPQLEKCKIKGQEKREEIEPTRVESVEVLKLRDIKKSKLYRDPDYVYCIDVEDNHNFFANGFLTHNCHRAKAGISSSMGKSFLGIAKMTQCWTGYTATPGDKWIDFYPYFVATNKISNKTHFMRKFCNVQTFKGYPEIVNYLNINTLEEWWKEIAYFPDTSIVQSQLPSETNKIIEFKKPSGYDKVIKERKRLDNGEFIDTTMGLCHYLRQVCATDAKYKWISDFIEGLGERCVIFYNYIEEGDKIAEVIRKVLPKDTKIWIINGQTHDVPTPETIGDRDIVLAQWTSGSASLNLQFMNYWVSFSPCYSLTVSVQGKGRIKRIGQKMPMFFYFLRCVDTIETDIYQCLSEKKDFSETTWREQKGI